MLVTTAHHLSVLLLYRDLKCSSYLGGHDRVSVTLLPLCPKMWIWPKSLIKRSHIRNILSPNALTSGGSILSWDSVTHQGKCEHTCISLSLSVSLSVSLSLCLILYLSRVGWVASVQGCDWAMAPLRTRLRGCSYLANYWYRLFFF